VVMSCRHRAPQRQKWLHSTGDGRTAPEKVDKTSSMHFVPRHHLCAWLSPVHPSGGAPWPFEGFDVGGGQEQAAQCLGMTLAYLDSACAVPVQHREWPHSDVGRFPGGVSRSVWGGFAF
jgi:hypothetical protein